MMENTYQYAAETNVLFILILVTDKNQFLKKTKENRSARWKRMIL